VLVAALAVALAAVGVNPVGAQTPPTTSAPVSTTSSVPAQVLGGSPDGKELPQIIDPRLDPDLSRVAVDNPAFDRALGRYRATEQALADAVALEQRSVAELADLTAAEARLVGTLNQSTRRLDKSDARLAELRTSLQSLAVDDYIRGGATMASDLNLSIDDATELRRQRVVVRTVRSTQLEDARQNTAVVDEMTAVIAEAVAELTEVRDRITTTTATRDRAVTDQARLRSQAELDIQAIADTRLEGNVVDQDFSLVALDAYYKAAKRMAFLAPSCRIGWSFIAGISRTEGRHGTYGGAELAANGQVDPAILGIALDGSNGTADIGDTDGGEYDGDPGTDRAVGPMQFIPSTWVRWAIDGNGDGEIDPQNMDDAAMAAAAYLCHSGPGLDADEGIRRAAYSYNQSDEYVELVLSRAKAYAEFRIPGLPVATDR
jgi:membrane-bound lytic murein transglycosylase B